MYTVTRRGRRGGERNTTREEADPPCFIKREERVAKYGNIRRGFEVQ